MQQMEILPDSEGEMEFLQLYELMPKKITLQEIPLCHPF